MPVTTQSGNSPPDGKVLVLVVTVVLKKAKNGPLAKALNREGFIKFLMSFPSASQIETTSDMHKMMALRHPSQLATRECGRHPSFTTYNMEKVIQLMIGCKSPRKPLIASGPVKHVLEPLKRTTTLYYLLLPLSVRRKFSL